jgi:hypothetical protein
MALKVLVRSLTEIDAVAELLELELELALALGAAAALLLLLLLPLLQAAMSTAAAPAATAVSPALDTEYNDVPRLLARHALRHVRDQSVRPGQARPSMR